MNRNLAFVLGALPIVGILALLIALRADTPATPPPPAAKPSSPPAAPAGPDRPDVAIPPGRERAPAGSETPSAGLGNADLTRPIDRGDGPRDVKAAASLFAADWLDYLAGDRPASAVRAAAPKLLLGFAGSEPGGGIGPGRSGLRGVTCRPGARGRHLCIADVSGPASGPLRFVMSTTTPGAPVQAIALELE